jgi:hypothetical protein
MLLIQETSLARCSPNWVSAAILERPQAHQRVLVGPWEQHPLLGQVECARQPHVCRADPDRIVVTSASRHRRAALG